MRIDTGHTCKHCCYFTKEDGDTTAYCCIDPIYTEVKPNQQACDSYASDEDDDIIIDIHNNIYDGDDDENDLY